MGPFRCEGFRTEPWFLYLVVSARTRSSLGGSARKACLIPLNPKMPALMIGTGSGDVWELHQGDTRLLDDTMTTSGP